jgi:hypothetical protein
MPIASGIQTLPLVLLDGTILSSNGLDRRYGLIMRCDPMLLRIMPDRAACDDQAVIDAFTFLVDDWLKDVPAGHHSKCIMIAYALSVIERLLFPARPIFLLTAGQRSVGKTTALLMLVMAVIGSKPAAAAWAANEEERKKAIFAYLLEGMATLVWDNIQNGAKLTSNELNRACSFTTYSDRVLGSSATRVAPAYTIHIFTGNNIEAAGDLASRSLEARLEVNRADPQNRPVSRLNPVEWTSANRAAILRALYTILIGNPQLGALRATDGIERVHDTRFKDWHHLVGAAIENASKLYCGADGQPISFAKMFDQADATNDEQVQAGEYVRLLYERWPNGAEFTSSDVAEWIRSAGLSASSLVGATRGGFANKSGSITAQSIGEKLGELRDKPVNLTETTQLALKRRFLKGANRYWVEWSPIPGFGLFD